MVNLFQAEAYQFYPVPSSVVPLWKPDTRRSSLLLALFSCAGSSWHFCSIFSVQCSKINFARDLVIWLPAFRHGKWMTSLQWWGFPKKLQESGRSQLARKQIVSLWAGVCLSTFRLTILYTRKIWIFMFSDKQKTAPPEFTSVFFCSF